LAQLTVANPFEQENCPDYTSQLLRGMVELVAPPVGTKFTQQHWRGYFAGLNRQRLEEKGLSLRQGTIINATIIHAPSSTKNEEGKRDPEMRQPKKGNQYFFGTKAHIGAYAESRLVHHVHGTAANVADAQVAELLHGKENAVYADAGYTGVEKREEHENRKVLWQIAARRSTYSKLNKRSLLYKAKRKVEHCKAQTRAKVENPFRVIKRQFGYVKVRFRGLMKNTASCPPCSPCRTRGWLENN
jgi:IS5 family transposase